MEKANSKKTHWKKLHNPDYLGAYSLEPGNDMVLTIKIVKQEIVKSERGQEECTVAHFKEDVKPMILNVTNSKQIAKLYNTPYIEDWRGKRIQIYAATVRAFGEDMEALRIRPKVPASTKEELSPKHPKWNKAKTAISLGNTTLKAILKRYHVTEVNQAKLLKNGETAA